MRYCLLLFFICSTPLLRAQKVEIIQGIYFNKLYDNVKEFHYNSDYNSGSGYAFRLAYQSPKIKKMSWRFTVGYEQYSGEIRAFDGGNGGGNGVEAKINKSIISFGVFPLNFTFWNRLNINFGLEFSSTVFDSFEGEKRFYLILPATSTSEDLKDIYTFYNSFLHFGLKSRLAYDFKLSNKIALSPQYSFYYGLTSEFRAFPKQTKSMRHYLSLGLIWNL